MEAAGNRLDGRMSKGIQERQQRLMDRLKSRTHRDGSPRNGYEQNVATIRAELEIIQERLDSIKDEQLG